MKTTPPTPNTKVTNPEAAIRFLLDACGELAGGETEAVAALYLNGCNEILAYECMNTGTMSSCLIDFRKIARDAIDTGAKAVIISHNHPSSTCNPSQGDIEQTKQLRTALGCFGIDLADHIVIGKDGYFSFREERVTAFPGRKRKITWIALESPECQIFMAGGEHPSDNLAFDPARNLWFVPESDYIKTLKLS